MAEQEILGWRLQWTWVETQIDTTRRVTVMLCSVDEHETAAAPVIEDLKWMIEAANRYLEYDLKGWVRAWRTLDLNSVAGPTCSHAQTNEASFTDARDQPATPREVVLMRLSAWISELERIAHTKDPVVLLVAAVLNVLRHAILKGPHLRPLPMSDAREQTPKNRPRWRPSSKPENSLLGAAGRLVFGARQFVLPTVPLTRTDSGRLKRQLQSAICMELASMPESLDARRCATALVNAYVRANACPLLGCPSPLLHLMLLIELGREKCVATLSPKELLEILARPFLGNQKAREWVAMFADADDREK